MADRHARLGCGGKGIPPAAAVAAQGEVSGAIAERGIQLCWVLQALLSIPDRHSIAFKGGASLAKVHGLLDCFSEDAGISRDCRRFGEGFGPSGQVGRAQYTAATGFELT